MDDPNMDKCHYKIGSSKCFWDDLIDFGFLSKQHKNYLNKDSILSEFLNRNSYHNLG